MDKKKRHIPLVHQKENIYSTYGLFLAFAVFVFIFSTYKVTGDDDFFWHLAAGRYIIENKSVPDKDVFGYVTQGQAWIPFEWGWDVLTFLLYNIGGFNLILIFRSAAFVLVFAILFFLLKKFKVNPLFIFAVFMALIFAIIDRLSPRPHVITYIFFVAVLYILICFKYNSAEKYYRRLYLVPVIFLLWGNVHMGVLAGGLILFVFTISELLIYFHPKRFSSPEIRPLKAEQMKKLVIISVLSGLVLLLNPHGIETYLYAYNHTKMKMLETVNEWRSPFDPMYGTGFVTTLYKVFLFGGIIILIYAYRKRDIFFALIYLSFVAYSVRAIRFTVDFEIVMAFFFAVSLNNIFPADAMLRGRFNNFLKLSFSVCLVYLIYLIPSGELYRAMKYYRVFGYGINDEYLAVQLFDFMKANNIKGTTFNHFGTGGMLVWYFPDQKNFIDSRNLNDEIFNEYNNILGMRPGFESRLKKYGVEYVVYLDPDLVRRIDDLKRIVVAYLSKNPEEWKLVFWDDKSFLFLRNIPAYNDIISKYEYKILNPYDFLFRKDIFEDKVLKNPLEAREELNRKLSLEPGGMLTNAVSQVLNKMIK